MLSTKKNIVDVCLPNFPKVLTNYIYGYVALHIYSVTKLLCKNSRGIIYQVEYFRTNTSTFNEYVSSDYHHNLCCFEKYMPAYKTNISIDIFNEDLNTLNISNDELKINRIQKRTNKKNIHFEIVIRNDKYFNKYYMKEVRIFKINKLHRKYMPTNLLKHFCVNVLENQYKQKQRELFDSYRIANAASDFELKYKQKQIDLFRRLNADIFI